MSTYICSDIHGQYDLYKAMLQAIDFSESDQLFILGDMIDRGPDGLQILQDAASRPNVTCLIGNHESRVHDVELYLPSAVFEGLELAQSL